MAQTKRISPHQHYHVEIKAMDGDTRREGSYRYDQGPGGANEAVRAQARAAVRRLSPNAEVRRIGVGYWTVSDWSLPSDAPLEAGALERLESLWIAARVCFEADHLSEVA